MDFHTHGPATPPRFEDLSPEFDTFRGVIVQLLRDEGYAATSAIAICRRQEVAIREGWINDRDPAAVVKDLIEFEEAEDTDTE